MFKLIPLGTRGFIPSYGRQTMSFLLLDGSRNAILLDAGTGLSRMIENQVATYLEDIYELHIILSHYHLDHVCGLPYLADTWAKKKLILYCPGPPYVDANPQGTIARLLSPPLFSLKLSDYPCETHLKIVDGPTEINGHKFDFLRLDHDGGCLGMKIDNTLAYLTDTPVKKDYETFVQSCKTLLHDTWITKEEAKIRKDQAKRHSVVDDVTAFAQKCDVSFLHLVHLHPTWNEAKLKLIASECKFSALETIIADEGAIYEV